MNNVCYAGTSLAHTYGNMTAIITEYVKSLFPRNYFKTVFVTSTIAYRQTDVLRNKNKEFFRKNKPMLIIKPRIDISDADKFMFGTLLTERIYDLMEGYDPGNLQPFVEDAENNISMQFLLNRLKMMFDVTIIHDTMIEQLNMGYYFKNRVRQEHNFNLNVFLESYVPRNLLDIIGEASGVPIFDVDGKVKPFIDYVNAHSIYPITYKMKDSTGNDEFFRFYPAKVDTLISGLSIDDGSKRGFVSESFPTSFSITTEFWGAGLYYLFSPIASNEESFIPSKESTIIPIYTIPIHELTAPVNWNVYGSTFYKVEADITEDIVDFSSLIGTNLEASIKYYKSTGVPIETFLTDSVMMDETFLDKTLGDYSIDYEAFTITTRKLNPVSTYRLVLYVNTLYLNEEKMKLFELPVDDN